MKVSDFNKSVSFLLAYNQDPKLFETLFKSLGPNAESLDILLVNSFRYLQQVKKFVDILDEHANSCNS